jgi:quercetin dioxygenase-like cupin family protein
MKKTPSKYYLARSNSRKRVHRELPGGKNPLSYSYHCLSNPKAGGKKLQAFFIEFQSGIREEIPISSHSGEEFLYLLQGTLDFNSTEGTCRLKKGDAIHFDAGLPHAFVNVGKRVANAVVVIHV